MNCDETKLMLAAYADGELTSVENDAVISHLEQCGRCRQIVRDQQRVQHVLDAYQPPPVADEQWDALSKALRTELAGKGERAALKTRSRVEGLEPTPMSQAPLAPEEARPSARPAREVPSPAARPRTIAYGMVPAVTVLKVRPRKARSPFGWVAHLMGAVAAGLLIALALGTLEGPAAPPLDASTLARQNDVAILEVTTDADYSTILYVGDADDVAAVWVVPSDANG